jgi:hypothetical protein
MLLLRKLVSIADIAVGVIGDDGQQKRSLVVPALRVELEATRHTSTCAIIHCVYSSLTCGRSGVFGALRASLDIGPLAIVSEVGVWSDCRRRFA